MSNDMKTVRIPTYIGEEPLVGRYYMAECERCGWLGSSSELTDECQCTREEGGGMCLGHTLEVEPERLFAIIQTMGSAHADLEALHGGELGLPKEGWPAYHKRKMETMRDLKIARYESRLAERDALIVRVLQADLLSTHSQLWKDLAALSASAEQSATTGDESSACVSQSTSIQRYDIQGGDGYGVYPEEDAGGEWVRYEDVHALLFGADLEVQS